ncbi:MAG: efflux RND transporter periplasmic adaptor subunit [Candidatus Sulfotelmatobacter sp.]
MRSTTLSLWILTSTIALLTTSCKEDPAASNPPVPVRTAMVQTVAVGNPVKYSASIVPYSQVDLAFQSGGYVDHVLQVKSADGGMRNIDQGDWARKGTVLALVRQDSYKDKLGQAQAQLSRAQAEHEKAKLSFDRVSTLYSAQSATKPDLDSAQAQLDSTTASVSGAEAQVGEARTALADCSLRAPFDGWIVKRTVDTGSFVGPATNGFTIASTKTVKAVFGVPDTSINRVRLGQSLAITTDALAQPFRGRITAISPSADPKSRVFSVELTIDNARNSLKSGMIATLALDGAQLPQAVSAIPLSAVIRDPQVTNGFAVMVAKGDSEIESANIRSVELGSVYGNMIAIASGLRPGEKVVTTGVTLIKNGASVRVIP